MSRDPVQLLCYLVRPSTSLPVYKGFLTVLLVFTSWLSSFQSFATRSAYEFFLRSNLLLFSTMLRGSAVKRVCLPGFSPICSNKVSGLNLSLPLSIL